MGFSPAPNPARLILVAGLVALALLVSGCAQSSSAPAGGAAPDSFTPLPTSLPQASPTTTTAKGTVRAAEGGTISDASGSLSLAVPPGALPKDTEITLRHTVGPVPSGGPALSVVALEPDGMTFQKNTTLSVKLPQPMDPEELQVYLVSGKNAPFMAPGDGSLFQKVSGVSYDRQTGAVQVPVQHFSWVTFAAEAKVYLAFDIPGENLKKGDILFTLTGFNPDYSFKKSSGGSWVPGHVGLYMGTQDPWSARNDGKTVIESTIEHAPSGYKSTAVQWSTLNQFKDTQGHIYLGARRPLFPVSDDERNKTAAWAVGKLGTPWGFIGASPDSSKLSCVGLTENAWLAGTGDSIVGSFELLAPITQYYRTAPVREVDVPAGTDFNMQVVGVVRVPPSSIADLNPLHWLNAESGHYISDSSNGALYTVTVTGRPGTPAADAVASGRAKIHPVGRYYLFTLQTRPEDEGLFMPFALTVDAKDRGKVTESFIVTVKEPFKTMPISKSVKDYDVAAALCSNVNVFWKKCVLELQANNLPAYRSCVDYLPCGFCKSVADCEAYRDPAARAGIVNATFSCPQTQRCSITGEVEEKTIFPLMPR